MGIVRRPANIEQYILDHLEEALKRNYIKVYVQPVVRTMTRQYCGMEALARWEDPEYGLLMPGEFIGVLEKHRRIHELDIHMLNKVCETFKLMGKRIDVPISINFSRLDYELCDIFEKLESTVLAHKVRRSSLCIEITESTLASNEELMRQYIDRFRRAGYAVWMDDFGSGYSSLNVLKDYMFDEMKIDMRFLSDTSLRSKNILASIVNMAKEIGIQTLAEGVETEEQFEFLRNIGCEKVQGYLFGKPMPFEECLKYVAEAGMTWEPPNLRWYYDNIGRVNVLSARPFHTGSADDVSITGRELNSIAMAIVEMKGKQVKMLYANQAFDKIAAAVDWPFMMEHRSKPLALCLDRFSQHLRNLLEEARTEGESKLFSVYDNDYYEMRARRQAYQGDMCAILMSAVNLSQMSAMISQQHLDEGLRSLYSVYEQVSVIDLNEQTVVSLYLDRESGQKQPTRSLPAHIEEHAENRIYPDDRDRFRRFMDPSTLEERAAQSGGTSIHLRCLTFHGSYSWKCYLLVRIRQNTYYLLIRSAEKEVKELQSRYQSSDELNELLTPVLLWENVVNHAEMKFFWKDTKRRFVGASRSFLNHYHFKSLSDIVGKTDEDMGWHIHNDPFRDEEWKVLKEGITSKRVEGNCLVQGENCDIVATKMPLFSHDGKIVGLIGTFYQTNSRSSVTDSSSHERTDDLTGLLNTRGLYENLFSYIDEYELRGRDFARIEVSIDDLENINSRFGYDFGDDVIREIGRKLLERCGNTATIGRISGSYFLVLRQFENHAELESLISEIRQISKEPCQVAGGSFSIYLSVGMATYSETNDRNSMADQAEMRRMTDDVEHISQSQLIENTRRIFHVFDGLPLAYVVFKIVGGGEDGGAIVLYVNRFFTQVTELVPEELVGRRADRFFELETDNWFSVFESASEKGENFTGIVHGAREDYKIKITAYRVMGPEFCAFTFKSIKRVSKKKSK